MQPLDVVKTRMHLQGLGVRTGDNFQGTLGAIRGIQNAEGFMGLWRGFIPGLCVVIPRRGFKFVFYEGIISRIWSGSKGTAPFGHSMAAGGVAGALEACIITPIECVKIAMQSDKAATTGTKPPGMASFVSNMIRSGGVASLYSGLAATISKHAAHSMFYFAAFHGTKKLAPAGEQSRTMRIAWDLGAGFIAGCAAATANNPFDVVKTRQQVGAAAGMSHHAAAMEFSATSGKSMPAWMVELVRGEGVAALYKGYVAKVARLGPGSAIIFCVYEQVMGLL
jgi:solute carrier family 25 2-oxodicarboxylate transporter 21